MDARAARGVDLANSVGVLLTFLSNRLTATGSATFRRRFGLGILEVRLLLMLAAEPASSPGRIRALMGLDAGAVSRALRALQARGLVTSRPDPRNAAYGLWSLTSHGIRIQDEMAPVSMQRDAILLSAFTAEERAQLVSMLRRMLNQIEGLRELVEPPAPRKDAEV